MGPSARGPGSPNGADRGGRSRRCAGARDLAVRARLDPRPLPARAARPGADPAPGTSLSARFRSLRRVARDLRAVSRNRPSLASAALLPTPVGRGQIALRRGRSLRVAAGLALERHPAVVRPRRPRDDASALHRSAVARLCALGQTPGALLSVRGDDDRALVRWSAHLPHLSGRAPVGGGGERPAAWADQDPAQPGARPFGSPRLPLDFRLEADRPEPLRGDPVAPCGLRIPLLPVRGHDRLEDAVALVGSCCWLAL